MTDTLDRDDVERPGVAGASSVTTCQREGCGVALPLEGDPGFHPMRKYCDEHQPGKRKAKAPKVEPGGEGLPPSVNLTLDLGGKGKGKATKGDADAAKVAAGAERMLGLIPLVLAMTGDQVCPPAIAEAIPAIAAQLGELARYHKGLVKVFAGGEGTGEAVAWLGLMAATTPVVITVLAHHGLISKSVADRFAAFVSVAGGAGGDQ